MLGGAGAMLAGKVAGIPVLVPLVGGVGIMAMVAMRKRSAAGAGAPGGAPMVLGLPQPTPNISAAPAASAPNPFPWAPPAPGVTPAPVAAPWSPVGVASNQAKGQFHNFWVDQVGNLVHKWWDPNSGHHQAINEPGLGKLDPTYAPQVTSSVGQWGDQENVQVRDANGNYIHAWYSGAGPTPNGWEKETIVDATKKIPPTMQATPLPVGAVPAVAGGLGVGGSLPTTARAHGVPLSRMQSLNPQLRGRRRRGLGPWDQVPAGARVRVG